METFSPKKHEITKEDEEIDRKQSAVELSENAMEYERMDYGARDLNAFAALTSQQAAKSFEDRAIKKEKVKEVAPPVHKKDFYEELYDRQGQKN